MKGCGHRFIVGPTAAGDSLIGEVRPTLRKMTKKIKQHIFKDTFNQFLGLFEKVKSIFPIVLSFYHLLVKTF